LAGLTDLAQSQVSVLVGLLLYRGSSVSRLHRKKLLAGKTGKIRRLVTAGVLVLILSIGIVGIVSFSGPRGREKTAIYFPLHPNATWIYDVDSQSPGSHYILTDRAKGEQFVDKLNRSCQIVDENYEIERGGVRPIIYYYKDGFLDRLSGLEYVGQSIEFPVWTLSEEKHFLPIDLGAKTTWNNTILPYGSTSSAPTVYQFHRSFHEPRQIVVPAGGFQGCVRVETDARYEGGPYKEPVRLHYVDWYAPNVGLVKTLEMEGGPNGKVIGRIQLVKFEDSEPSIAVPRPK
jgi:hypothetical protein